MNGKYDSCLKCKTYKTLCDGGYEQMFINMIYDDEMYVTEEMKIEFFTYLQKFDHESDLEKIREGCNNFLSQDKYSLKGKKADKNIYKIELGRVVSKVAIVRRIVELLKQRLPHMKDDRIIEGMVDDLCRDYGYKYELARTDTNDFETFIKSYQIEDCNVQRNRMWTFSGWEDKNVFSGIRINDLPCLLGLPGPDGTDRDYNDDSCPRIAFALTVPATISVHKPTSFDAGVSTVWRSGGKTQKHPDYNKSRYDTFSGCDEFIHESVNFSHITSNIYRV